ncbi:hypothetical protein [Allopontixanthobacter confluentis]|nr:hypothetical protein [Allopontixanthobacter confluentis]
MEHMITFMRRAQSLPVDALRMMIVTGCALALIMAGQPVPVLAL